MLSPWVVLRSPTVVALRLCTQYSHYKRNHEHFHQVRTSYIGRKPILIPHEVTMNLEPAIMPRDHPFPGFRYLSVTGPLGKLRIPIAPFIQLNYERTPDDIDNSGEPRDPNDMGDPTDLLPGARRCRVAIEDDQNAAQKARWGLTRTLFSNAVIGVTEGFQLPVRLNGVGYRAAMAPPCETSRGRPVLALKLGYSHPCDMPVPEGITCTTPSPTQIMLFAADKQQLGEFAASIRRWRKPEPYKQKGVFVGGETIAKKVPRKAK